MKERKTSLNKAFLYQKTTVHHQTVTIIFFEYISVLVDQWGNG